MPRNTIHLPTKETYDLWASTYDTDGNILQSLDSRGLQNILLPRMIDSLLIQAIDVTEKPCLALPLRFIDLGCGTGRATMALQEALRSVNNIFRVRDRTPCSTQPFVQTLSVEIKGLDASDGMLKVAEKRVPSPITLSIDNFDDKAGGIPEAFAASLAITTSFERYDLEQPIEASSSIDPAHAIVCSLVIEHLQSLHAFFEHLIKARLIRPQGFLLLTNMHPDMAQGAQQRLATPQKGANGHLVTGAGFIDAATGDKIRAEGGFAHTIPDVLATASAHGFQLVGNDEMEEMKVELWMLDKGLVDAKRGLKWAESGVMCWFGGVFRYIKSAQNDRQS